MIDSAHHAIDMETFLWMEDALGMQVAGHLLAAADRGVKIRLLLDDAFTSHEDLTLLALVVDGGAPMGAPANNQSATETQSGDSLSISPIQSSTLTPPAVWSGSACTKVWPVPTGIQVRTRSG